MLIRPTFYTWLGSQIYIFPFYHLRIFYLQDIVTKVRQGVENMLKLYRGNKDKELRINAEELLED